MEKNVLLYSNSKNADFFYSTGYYSSDKMILLIKGTKKFLAVSDLEFEPARKKAVGAQVIAFSELGGNTIEDKIISLVKLSGAKSVCVPAYTPVGLVNSLGKKIGVTVSGKDLFAQRQIKKSSEVNAIKRAVFHTQKSIGLAKNILRESMASGGKLFYKNKPLTSDLLRNTIEQYLFSKGILARDTIVSCGRQSAWPHERGSGFLLSNQPIIIDVFPQDQKTRYYADITRTFCKGRPDKRLQAMFDAVLLAQEKAIEKIKDGASVRNVHEAAFDSTRASGFLTDLKNRTGFFHSTGHGLGLDVHEEPRIGFVDGRLRAGMVVTVEPGLYYPHLGGVRIEDDVLVTKSGCGKLSGFSKELVV
ncbi:M24 family metallopeptidase [Candidatus Micrarchaeota archaeon]|nr:M24 family metallopeptidase [Candidatus Micrarchaeota archaeon]